MNRAEKFKEKLIENLVAIGWEQRMCATGNFIRHGIVCLPDQIENDEKLEQTVLDMTRRFQRMAEYSRIDYTRIDYTRIEYTRGFYLQVQSFGPGGAMMKAYLEKSDCGIPLIFT